MAWVLVWCGHGEGMDVSACGCECGSGCECGDNKA